MNKQLDTLITLRDNINVIVQTLLYDKDLTGETLPHLDHGQLGVIEEAEEITRQMMYEVDPTTDPNYESDAEKFRKRHRTHHTDEETFEQSDADNGL